MRNKPVAYVIYDEFGKIVKSGLSTDTDVKLMSHQGSVLLLDPAESVNDAKHYIERGKIKIRPVMSISIPDSAMSGDTCKISGIPSGAEVYVSGEKFTPSVGDFEWVERKPGAKKVKVVKFPFMDFTAFIDVSG